MQALFLRCSVTLRRAAASHSNGSGSDADGQRAQQQFRYELHVSQDLEDGTYHEADEEPQQETIPVQDIAGWLAVDCTAAGDTVASLCVGHLGTALHYTCTPHRTEQPDHPRAAKDRCRSTLPSKPCACVTTPRAFAAGIDWSTTQSLSLGDNDFSPALVLSIDREAGSARLGGQDASAPLSTPVPAGPCLCQPEERWS